MMFWTIQSGIVNLSIGCNKSSFHILKKNPDSSCPASFIVQMQQADFTFYPHGIGLYLQMMAFLL